MPAEARVEQQGSDVVVVLSGEVDVAFAGELDEALRMALAEATRVCVDLSGVAFIDSSGLRSLLNARQDHGDRIVVGQVSPAVGRVVDLAGIGAFLGLDA